MNNKIKDLPCEERPYEKFSRFGVKSLTDAELLSVILKTGTRNKSSVDVSRDVLLMPDGTYNILAICNKPYEVLTGIPGIGSVKAITIKCIAELSERIVQAGYSTLIKFNKPDLIAEYYMERFRHLDHEEFCVIFLNSSNHLITEKVITQGTINQSLVSAREVFINALQLNAVNIVLLHNHPSGDPTPSRDDIHVTEIINEAGTLLNIRVLDHIIIGDRTYISFKECKLL